mmetsp:Transcript_50488/g.158979  ORF Transcript_50488/g.158979 Transcript_50488/m.158979 type:complete len:205 (+) Transcript_50488:101-715(+)
MSLLKGNWTTAPGGWVRRVQCRGTTDPPWRSAGEQRSLRRALPRPVWWSAHGSGRASSGAPRRDTARRGPRSDCREASCAPRCHTARRGPRSRTRASTALTRSGTGAARGRRRRRSTVASRRMSAAFRTKRRRPARWTCCSWTSSPSSPSRSRTLVMTAMMGTITGGRTGRRKRKIGAARTTTWGARRRSSDTLPGGSLWASPG